MLYTEISVRDNVRNRDGKRVFYLGKGDTLTAGARDWLLKERIEILPAQKARPDRFYLMGGGFLEEKPEHMTHLNAQILVPKTHPRIAFRGAMDTLEAELLLCQLEAEPKLRRELEEILTFARHLLRNEVLNEPVAERPLCGLNEQQLRQHSHFPQDHYGQPHFMPAVSDGKCILQLNRARCAARAAELQAVHAFTDREGNPTRVDLLRAMNRLSSMIYILMIRQKANSTE
jgi:ethanolamine utilization cobalamin adenosyltransferase